MPKTPASLGLDAPCDLEQPTGLKSPGSSTSAPKPSPLFIQPAPPWALQPESMHPGWDGRSRGQSPTVPLTFCAFLAESTKVGIELALSQTSRAGLAGAQGPVFGLVLFLMEKCSLHHQLFPGQGLETISRWGIILGERNG